MFRVLSLKFKSIALNKALNKLHEYDGEIESGKQAMKDVEGIGKGISKRIDEIISTGTLKELKTNSETSIEKDAMFQGT